MSSTHCGQRALTLILAFALGLLPLAAKTAIAADPVKPLKALLVIGGCCHDYKSQKDILVEGLQARAHVEVSIAYDPDTTNTHLNPVYDKADWATAFDVIIHDECSSNVKELAVID